MSNLRATRSAALTLMLLAVAPLQANAQDRLSLWPGLGYSSTEGSTTLGKSVKQLGAQLAIPLMPIAVRADVLLFGGTYKSDALSYNVNAVYRVRLPVVQPYVMVGRGSYATSLSTRETGWNYGAGVHVGLGRPGLFVEYRRHAPVGRSVTVIGLTFCAAPTRTFHTGSVFITSRSAGGIFAPSRRNVSSASSSRPAESNASIPVMNSLGGDMSSGGSYAISLAARGVRSTASMAQMAPTE